MAIIGYSGPPGSGKSYEVVKFMVIPAYAKGRRIVTNLILNEAFIRNYIENHKSEFRNFKFGEIVYFKDDELDNENCFPHLVEVEGTQDKKTIDGSLGDC